uniref:Secreted protein n=1 Tax=Ixodes ricinus TaxID=34613 RepID=A0A6B0UDP4_IXORI
MVALGVSFGLLFDFVCSSTRTCCGTACKDACRKSFWSGPALGFLGGLPLFLAGVSGWLLEGAVETQTWGALAGAAAKHACRLPSGSLVPST